MSDAFVRLSADTVIAIHDRVIGEGELAGLARDKSIEGALARVDTRLAYGMIEDVSDLAATYAMSLARGHVFNDANKRTAFATMHLCLRINGAQPGYDVIEAAERILDIARGDIDEVALAAWLRRRIGRAG